VLYYSFIASACFILWLELEHWLGSLCTLLGCRATVHKHCSYFNWQVSIKLYYHFTFRTLKSGHLTNITLCYTGHLPLYLRTCMIPIEMHVYSGKLRYTEYTLNQWCCTYSNIIADDDEFYCCTQCFDRGQEPKSGFDILTYFFVASCLSFQSQIYIHVVDLIYYGLSTSIQTFFLLLSSAL